MGFRTETVLPFFSYCIQETLSTLLTQKYETVSFDLQYELRLISKDYFALSRAAMPGLRSENPSISYVVIML